MIFVKTDDLKEGMRLAKPIYNRNGVMLYDRNSKLTTQGINSIRNFELIGIFVLEPAEPLPPMTAEDIEFERFQTVAVFSLRDNLKLVLEKNNSRDLLKLANTILENYGSKRSKLQFVQNLRSKQDYVYRHTLNVAILCGLIAGAMELPKREKLDVIMAGLLHDVGKLLLPKEVLDHVDNLSQEEEVILAKCKEEAYNTMLTDYDMSPNSRIMVAQFTKLEQGGDLPNNAMRGTRILSVAEVYDFITAIKMGDEEAMSSVQAIKYLKKHEDEFGADVLEGLMSAIQVLVPGVCVTMTNGARGLVIEENKEDIMRPIVLDFNSHRVYNLADPDTFAEVQVQDVMKTMDNRYVMDHSLLEEYSGKLSYKRRNESYA